MTIAWSTAAIHDEHGVVTNVICGGLDVTQRKQYEIELDRERDFLSKVTDITPSLLIVVDDEARIVEDAVNDSFVEVMGWSDEEMRGRSFGELFHEEDRYFAAIGVASAFNGVDSQLRSRWITHDGGERIMEWTATPIVDILGRAACSSAVTTSPSARCASTICARARSGCGRRSRHRRWPLSRSTSRTRS